MDPGYQGGLFDSWFNGPIGSPVVPPPATVTPPAPSQIDPAELARATYGLPISMFSGGEGAFGGRMILGPYNEGGLLSAAWQLACPINVNDSTGGIDLVNGMLGGARELQEVWLEGKTYWTPDMGPMGDFGIEFRGGSLDQTPLALELAKFPDDPCAYRPHCVISITGLNTTTFSRPDPYLSAKIGDITGGADPSAGLNLGDAIYRHGRSLWVGYSAEDFSVFGITDLIDAEMFGEFPHFVDLLATIARFYSHIKVTRGGQLRVFAKDRSVPDAVLTLDDIVAGSRPVVFSHDAPESVPAPWQLTTVDPDFDYMRVPSLSLRSPDVAATTGTDTVAYELPFAMQAAPRQALVTFAQFAAEVARDKLALTLMPRLVAVEPSDLLDVSCLGPGFGQNFYEVEETTTYPNFSKYVVMKKVLRCAASFQTSLAAVNTTGVSLPNSSHWFLSDANSDAFTIEWSYRQSSLSPDSWIPFDFFPGLGQYGFQLRFQGPPAGITTGFFFFWSSDGSTIQQFSVALTFVAGVFTRYCLEKNASGKIRFYVNGVMMGSVTPADSTIFHSNGQLLVGSGASGETANFDNGRITKGVARYDNDAGYAPSFGGSDPHFANVVFLSDFQGADGLNSTLVEQSSYAQIMTFYGAAHLSNAYADVGSFPTS